MVLCNDLIVVVSGLSIHFWLANAMYLLRAGWINWLNDEGGNEGIFSIEKLSIEESVYQVLINSCKLHVQHLPITFIGNWVLLYKNVLYCNTF